MAADVEKFKNFLKQIIIDPGIQTLDPINMAPRLKADDVITETEYEKIMNRLESRDERRLFLFDRTLSLKPPDKVLRVLGKICLEDDIARLKELIENQWGAEYLLPQKSSDDTSLWEKLDTFLILILRDPALRQLDPIDIAPRLKADDVLTDAQYEKIMRRLETRDERKNFLFQYALSLKPPEKVISALGKISVENDIARLRELIQLQWRFQYTLDNSDTSYGLTVQYLKDFYKNDCEIMKKHWAKLMDYPEEFEMDDMYIDLEIIKEGRRSHEKITCFQELFGVRDGKRKYRKIVLEGDPGMGKTTYVHHLVLEWAEGNEWLNKEFELVLLVRVGDIKHEPELSDIVPKMDAHLHHSLVTYISQPQNHAKILIILDGFDEMPNSCGYLDNLLEQRCFGTSATMPVGNITLLITTRISHARAEQLDRRDFSVRTVGFCPEIVMKKFSTKIKNLESLSSQSDQAPLSRNPLFVGMAASLGFIPEEVFDLMDEFCQKAIERYVAIRMCKMGTMTRDEIWKRVGETLGHLALAKLNPLLLYTEAYNYVSERAEELMKLCEDNADAISPEALDLCYDVGLIWPKKPARKDIRYKDNISDPDVSFPHQLFMEYFAAVGASNIGLLDELIECFEEVRYGSVTGEPFSYFLTGLSPQWKSCMLAKSIEQFVFNVKLICPYIYKPRDLPDTVPENENVVMHVDEICGNDSRNHGSFLKYFVPKYKIQGESRLSFEDICFDDNSAQILAQFSEVEHISFGGCSLPENNEHAFECSVSNQGFRSIEVYQCDNRLLESMLRAMCHSPALNQVESFTIGTKHSTNEVDEHALCLLAEYLSTSSNLKDLRFHSKGIGASRQIFEALPMSIPALDIESCELSKEASDALLSYLRKTTSLKKLVADGNPMLGSVPEFAEALVESCLEEVNLIHCNLSQEFIERFLREMEKGESSFKEFRVRCSFSRKKETNEEQLLRLEEAVKPKGKPHQTPASNAETQDPFWFSDEEEIQEPYWVPDLSPNTSDVPYSSQHGHRDNFFRRWTHRVRRWWHRSVLGHRYYY